MGIEKSIKTQHKSNIYKGKIHSIENSLEAIFVNYGRLKHGFLPFKEFCINKKQNVNYDYFKINNFIKQKYIMIQIIKEERKNKGAYLTTFISLSGCYLVLIP